MNKREIEQQIIQDFKQTTPDILHRIHLESIEIIEPVEPFYKRFFKPIFIPSFAIAAIILLFVFVLNIGENTPPIIPGPDPTAFSEREETYTLSALSAISLLNQIDEETTLSNTLSLMFLNTSFTDSGPTLLLDDHLSQLNRNLAMIEPLIGQREMMNFQTIESELEQYSYKVIFSNNDMRNQTIEYVLHYNEIQEDEDTYYIDGIMIIDNITYNLEGELSLTEDEYELEVIAHHPFEEDTYVAILQEVSKFEHTLEYEVVKNDATLYESEMSFEIDGDEITIEIAYESENLQYAFDIERTNINNTPVYYIEYEIETSTSDEEGEMIVEVVYNETEETYYYRYTIESDDTQVIRYIKRYSIVK